MLDTKEKKSSENSFTFSFNEHEAHQIRYALNELAFKRAEQAFDFGNPELTKESQFLMDLASRLIPVK